MKNSIKSVYWLIASLTIFGCNVADVHHNQDVKGASHGSSVKIFNKKNARFSMDVLLNKHGVKILSVSPYSAMNQGLKSVPANTPDSLHWVIKADNGRILAQGFVPDPRIVHLEPSINGKHGAIYREETAMFQLDVPVDQGTLTLFENNPSFTKGKKNRRL